MGKMRRRTMSYRMEAAEHPKSFCGMEPSDWFNVLIIGLVAGFAVLGLFLAWLLFGIKTEYR